MRQTVSGPVRGMLVAAALAVSACATGADGAATATSGTPDPEQITTGQTLFFDCVACHTTGRGEPNMQGPNLWGIFGSEAGKKPGFPYSEALANADIVWDEESLDQWLRKPSEFIPGNLMAYVGMADPENRAALIAYLRSATSGD